MFLFSAYVEIYTMLAVRLASSGQPCSEILHNCRHCQSTSWTTLMEINLDSMIEGCVIYTPESKSTAPNISTSLV